MCPNLMLHQKLHTLRKTLTTLSSRSFHTTESHPFHLLQQFQTYKTNPDVFTVSKLLSMAANSNTLDEGTQLHAFLLIRNVHMDVTAINSLINFYFKCDCPKEAERLFHNMQVKDLYTWTAMVSGYVFNGRMKQAKDLFEEMPCKNVVAWNSLISGFQMNGQDEVAIDLFNRMRREGVVYNNVTLVSVLKASVCLLRLRKAVHCLLVKSSWIRNDMVWCALVDMYSKHHDMLSLNGNTVLSSIVSWNNMISSYMQNGMQEKAFAMFYDMMKEDKKPNCFTMTSILSGCSNAKFHNIGQLFHGYTLKTGFHTYTSIGNSLITMYSEQGNTAYARCIFDTMLAHDVVSWTALLSAYIKINGLEEARVIFDTMPEKNFISWNTMMSGYLQNGKETIKSLKIFYDMELSDVKPDQFSYNCALTACANIEELEIAKSIHGKIIRRGYKSDQGVGNALITVYGKCGSFKEAKNCFDDMEHPNTISWNSLLTCHAKNGRGTEVLRFYEEMVGSGGKPNHVTFICLLSACSYMGNVTKGKEIFNEMVGTYGIIPKIEHYTCMVDLLGRAGLLSEANELIKTMDIEPDATIWGALLGASKLHSDVRHGRIAAHHIFMLEPYNTAALVALADIYASTKMWEEEAKIRCIIKDNKIVKTPGCSKIDISNNTRLSLSAGSCH